MIQLNIVNDGTGTHECGNYDVEMTLPDRPGILHSWERRHARVEGFARSRGWAELVREATAALEAAAA